MLIKITFSEVGSPIDHISHGTSYASMRKRLLVIIYPGLFCMSLVLACIDLITIEDIYSSHLSNILSGILLIRSIWPELDIYSPTASRIQIYIVLNFCYFPT